MQPFPFHGPAHGGRDARHAGRGRCEARGRADRREGRTRWHGQPFWNSFALAGAESDEVILENVEVPPDLVVQTEGGAQGAPGWLQTVGFLWFEALDGGVIPGEATEFVERVLQAGRADASARADLIVDAEGAMLCIESVAHTMLDDRGDRALAQALIRRYTRSGHRRAHRPPRGRGARRNGLRRR